MIKQEIFSDAQIFQAPLCLYNKELSHMRNFLAADALSFHAN
jgi:hypothetical protein